MSKGETQALKATIAFCEKDGIHPHNDDHMVIIIKCDEWDIKIVLIDQENSVDIMY